MTKNTNKSLRKKKQYNDAQLFVDGLRFLKSSVIIINNMNKNWKMQFGNDFIIDIRDMITCFSLSYKHKNTTEKLQYGLDAYRLIGKIEISLRIMFECGVITEKQNSSLSLLLGNLITQVSGWVGSIGGTIEYTDGVSETEEV